ncbi:MAG: hypothetical protein QE263_05495 [Vampirovibrionales bacterium]|nr:hypothetical protein [Vampirovibrionales bacterium]
MSSSASDAETSLPKEPLARGHHGGVFEGLIPIRTVLFQQGDARGALQALKTYQFKRGLAANERRAVMELVGLSYRILHEWEAAQQAFGEIPDPFQAGYCALLSGNVATAIRWWQPLIQKINPNHWALSLLGMVTGQLQRWPSMLQIRNYLEQDVYALAEAGQGALLDNVLACAPILLQINPEAPKLMGRSLLYARHFSKALELLLLGQRTLPQDSEVYFHLGQCYSALNDTLQARRCLHQCLMINPDYKPAQWLLETLPVPLVEASGL